MKRFITFLLLLLTCGASAQQRSGTICASLNSKDPLWVVNDIVLSDEKVANTFLKAIDTKDIESITVLRPENAIEKYGNKGQYGVVIITLKKEKKKGNLSGIKIADEVFPLIVVNDIEFSDAQAGRLFINNVIPDKIDNIVVLKNEEATKEYGEKGKNGVVLVTLKGVKPEKLDIPPYEPKNK